MKTELSIADCRPPVQDVRDRLMSGEVIVLRGLAESVDLMDEMRDASLEGIREALGEEVAERVSREGFDQLHTAVDAADIPAVTEAVSEIFRKKAPRWLKRMLGGALAIDRPFYFERYPNVRFLIPYDLTAPHRSAYKRFAEDHGDGKITPHGPHRDSWLDCPTNAINIWIALGPVIRGNGLTLFPGSYRDEFTWRSTGEIEFDANPGTPFNAELAPGDALLFHGDQLHASEINQTDRTRHVVSFRLSLEKPQFAGLHYHHYLHSGLADSALSAFAELPSDFRWGWLRTRLKWVGDAIRRRMGVKTEPDVARDSTVSASREKTAGLSVKELQPGSVEAVSRGACVARLLDGSIVGFARRCPHQGADLSLGTIGKDTITCPYHNLHFDLETGASACRALQRLRRYPVTVDGDRVTVRLDERVSDD